MCLISAIVVAIPIPSLPNFNVADFDWPRGRQRGSNIEIREGRGMATTISESNRKFYNLFLHMGVRICNAVRICNTSSTRRPTTKRHDEDRLRPNGAETHGEKNRNGAETGTRRNGSRKREPQQPASLGWPRASVSNCGGVSVFDLTCRD